MSYHEQSCYEHTGLTLGICRIIFATTNSVRGTIVSKRMEAKHPHTLMYAVCVLYHVPVVYVLRIGMYIWVSVFVEAPAGRQVSSSTIHSPSSF